MNLGASPQLDSPFLQRMSCRNSEIKNYGFPKFYSNVNFPGCKELEKKELFYID